MGGLGKWPLRTGRFGKKPRRVRSRVLYLTVYGAAPASNTLFLSSFRWSRYRGDRVIRATATPRRRRAGTSRERSVCTVVKNRRVTVEFVKKIRLNLVSENGRREYGNGGRHVLEKIVKIPYIKMRMRWDEMRCDAMRCRMQKCVPYFHLRLNRSSCSEYLVGKFEEGIVVVKCLIVKALRF